MSYERDTIVNAAPFRVTDGFRRLTTSAVDASITLAAGHYEAINDASVTLHLRWGATAAAASLPASGAAEETGRYMIPAGAVATIEVLDTATALHAALVSAAAGELWLRRIVVTP